MVLGCSLNKSRYALQIVVSHHLFFKSVFYQHLFVKRKVQNRIIKFNVIKQTLACGQTNLRR